MYLIQFETSQTYHFQVTGQIYEKCLNMITRVGIYGPHTQVKCLVKALIFGTYKNNILISSQIGFELYQSHSLTVTGFKSSKNSKYWVFGSLLETSI